MKRLVELFLKVHPFSIHLFLFFILVRNLTMKIRS